ncbi:MAG TPA: patatin-like phospholipase family protein [Thermoanaerobaculia bacterium]|nr:patatin-like phospholipase family protein [Thermoanaerobaculia bacterium]
MKKCDLVMKGGITSGIVYPGAVVELANEFRFVNIGGTSAGAIAAALTAAAEHRRQAQQSDAGFAMLAQLPRWLGESEGGRSRLLGLFKPSTDTEALFSIALAWLETPGTKRDKLFATLRTLARHFHRYGSMVLFVAAVMLAISLTSRWLAGAVFASIVTIAVAAIAFFVAAIVELIVCALRVLPRNGFGMASGAGGLTDWLARQIDDVAGAQTLTFGELRTRDIHLEMMTTNLTHGRPYRLPFDVRTFWFAPSEMRRLFPANVVERMIAAAPKEPPAREIRTPDGEELVPFPTGDDLPVVVATRMSLSFPILLSALPLWSIDFSRQDEERHPERCWFSDGGITSNFPVHFFDAPLPRWPTFAINLAERTKRYHKDGQRIYMPASNRSGINEWWTPFETLPGFLHAILETMQNWRDNMLLHLPGQRDRIAHVLLAPDEGGLNLTMNAQTIEDVAQRGREAGALFRSRYDTAWPNHRWIRFLSFMASLETTLEAWSRGFDPTQCDETPPSYEVTAKERRTMRDAALALHAHVSQNFSAKPFRKPVNRPRPEAVLRAMPRE